MLIRKNTGVYTTAEEPLEYKRTPSSQLSGMPMMIGGKSCVVSGVPASRKEGKMRIAIDILGEGRVYCDYRDEMEDAVRNQRPHRLPPAESKKKRLHWDLEFRAARFAIILKSRVVPESEISHRQATVYHNKGYFIAQMYFQVDGKRESYYMGRYDDESEAWVASRKMVDVINNEIRRRKHGY